MGIKKIVSMPKMLLLNIKLFRLKDDLKMSLYITRNIRIDRLHRGAVEIRQPLGRFMVEIGEGSSRGISVNQRNFGIMDDAKVVFSGNAYFAEGCVLRFDGGTTEFGKDFNANKNDVFWTSLGMKFGDDVLLGYDVYFRDDDGHAILPSWRMAAIQKLSLATMYGFRQRRVS